MELTHIIAQIESLAQELEVLKLEYDFARGRAEHHRAKALLGDRWAISFKAGAELRMLELQEAMNGIVKSMAILEQYADQHMYFEMMEAIRK